ncbi:MAG TPA: hypothetical protein VFK26_02145 [Gemmatimonadaceae bacterium]|nr:hypothetical protein [Gemmatimonadaceae bacterium]
MKPRAFLFVGESTTARFVRNAVVAAAVATICGSCKDSVAPPDPAADLVWTPVPGGTGVTLVDVSGTGAANIWAVGNDAILHYDGMSWSVAASGFSQNLAAVWAITPTDAWAVGSAGAIQHWDGASWTSVAGVTTSTLADVWGANASDVWAVGGDPVAGTGEILHFDGTSWTIIDTGTGFVTGVWGSSPSDVWFVGVRKNGFASAHPETLFHFNGSSFALMSIGPYDLYGVWGASPSDVWAVGADGDIGQAVVFHFNGIAWFETSIEDNQTLYSVWGTSHSDVWIAGNAPDVLRHYDGNEWSPITHPSPIRAGWSSSANDIWTVGESLLHATP